MPAFEPDAILPTHPPTRCVRLLLVDDHTLLRDTLKDRLDREPDLAVIGVAGDAGQATELARTQQPDVVVMDIDMPGTDSFTAAADIRRSDAQIRVIFLSAFVQDRYIEEALRVQARGYVTKRESAAVLVNAIRQVAAGNVYFSDDVRSRLVLGDAHVHLTDPGQTRRETLTTREYQILHLVAQGMPKKTMADELDLSIKTVENHVASIMRKLSLHDRVALTRYAIREGISKP